MSKPNTTKTSQSTSDNHINELTQSLHHKINDVRRCDIGLFKSRLHGIKKIADSNKQLTTLAKIEIEIDKSIQLKQRLINNLPSIKYPDLPVSDNVEVISEAIKNNQVVIIAGETGSGKTTQIPKICLELGRGIEGFIGHTQPRRIAARTVANRIAEELDSKLGEQVGFKIRFNDQVSDNSYIKLMTDGILLAEMQKDRLLRQYDTIIIDEAHERSLNIDFILGYLKQIVKKRPDLKVIITSATIDPMRFSKHFDNAPVIEVSGRTYPVDIHYRPLVEGNQEIDYISGIINAVEELSSHGQGDILVFLNGEREIRDAADALEKEQLRNTHILPLFSRLSATEQNRIFAKSTGRKIILSTNVAETSLTVPGIRYVIDPGTARISRYSYRTKVQRLPIEAISQASANQRAGRCGRVAAGICIRLYSEDDFNSRPEFTDPEILRTNLATVILQMLSLDLGAISDFPFVQPPDQRNINDGLRLLEELAAIKQLGKNTPLKLTSTGRALSRFHIDPRLAKMVLAAEQFGCTEQVVAIVSALSIQDVRERPLEKQQAADEKHSRFKDTNSDFISLLKLWNYINAQQTAMSNNQFRRLCKKEYLSYIRVREWQDIFGQLKQTLKESNIKLSKINEDNDGFADVIHQPLLAGLLSHLGNLDENREYKGARGSRFYIFPGSGVAKKSPKWLMAAELVETSRLFARMVAKIDVSWVEPLAAHLLKRSYSEPHWLKKQGAVFAYEQVSLYGMVLVAKRKVNFNQIEPETCRELFIREALVNGDSTINERFLQHNKKLVSDVEELEKKARRRDFLVDEQVLFEFYQEKIPQDVICQRSFLTWWKGKKKNDGKLLDFSPDKLLKQDAQLSQFDYPDTWTQGRLSLPLTYHFEPGEIDDGVSVNIPISILNQVDSSGFDWQIPALRLELITALIRGLPKQLRKNYVPAPNYAQACFSAMEPLVQPLNESLAKHLLRMTGSRLPEDCWAKVELPTHLQMNFKIVGEKGKVLKQGRNLESLKEQLQGKVQETIKQVADEGIERSNISQWDFNLPKAYEKTTANIKIQAFPALVDKKNSVAIELFESEQLAQQFMVKGVSRMVLLNIQSPVKYLEQKLPNKAKLGLYFNPFGKVTDLIDDCVQASAEHLICSHSELPRNEQDFNLVKDYVRAKLAECVLNAAIKIEQILSISHDIRKKLKGNVALNMIQAQGDIKQQLERLVFKGFVSASGIARLDDVTRYLKAMLKRLEKLPIDPNQDRLKMIEVDKVQELYQSFLNKQPKSQPIPEGVLDIRWMIEELKVSLYAQNLGTAFPVSVKRIQNKISELSTG